MTTQSATNPDKLNKDAAPDRGGRVSLPITAPMSSRGTTTIAEEVVSIIARLAAEQVAGVHQIGETSLRSIFSRARGKGIEAEVGLKQAAVDLTIVVDYGHPIPQVSDELRQVVIDAVEHMTGRQVVEVNIDVVDVHLPRHEKRPSRRALQ